MKLQVRPGMHDGTPRTLVDRLLGEADVRAGEDGDVVLTFVAADIHTASATQRFSITLSEPEIEMIVGAMLI